MVKSGSERASWAAPQLLHHLLRGYDLFAVKEAAFLGEELVLDVDGGHPGGLVLFDGAVDVKGIAVTGVSVAYHRNFHCISDIARVLDHFGLCQQPNVGVSPLGGCARACHVDGIKAY